MVLSTAQLFEGIVMRLSVLRYVVRSMSKRGLTDVNRQCERFYCEVLNQVYGYQLQNANDAQMNAAAVDLVDKGNRLCFQLSSTSTRDKVEKTIEKFIAHGLYNQYDRLMFMMLVDKTNHSKSFDTSGYFSFDEKLDIIDLDDLLGEIEKMPLDRMQRLSDYVLAHLHPVTRALSPDSLLAQAETIKALPPKNALSFLKHSDVIPGSPDANQLFKRMCKLLEKLADLSRQQREFFAFIFENGKERNGRVSMQIKTVEQRLQLDKQECYDYYKVLDEANLIMVDDEPAQYFQLNHKLDSFSDVCPMLKDYLDTPAKIKQVLVDCDFTLLD
ncbi:SMEK domain-containing protein [Burkholderia gladioli]|uniref:SMEK domain-containing protein n=1 Tax=Burkholderia gladioli TaxID=28095 RepID=UPI00163E4436|nr:SMEK domain-containing protein [Burkholderia gladioli]